jgi:hypothetical protein
MFLHSTQPALRKGRLMLGLFLLMMLALVTGQARSQEGASKTTTALTKVPADAAFFSASLRNKEQLDLFYKSNAYKTLRSLPIIKEAYQQMLKEMAKDKDNPIAMYKKFVENKDNQELVALLLEAISDEVFIYGGKTWTDFMTVLNNANNSMSWAPLAAALQAPGDPQAVNKAQIRAILLALQKNRAMLKIPEFVVGFKVADAKKVENQLNRLETIAGAMLEQIAPLKGKLSRKKVGKASFLTLEVDGSLIPWDDANLKEFEDKKDEFDDLIKHAKKMTLAVSLGVRDGYLLLGITSAVGDLEKIGGSAKVLANREEMKTLARFASKPLTGISYVSREFLASASGSRADFESIAKSLKELLGKNEFIKEARKKAIEKDLDALAADGKKLIPEYGAQLSFSFMTNSGFEGYQYDFGKHDHLKGISCKLQQYVGGDPIFAAVFGCKATGERYAMLTKWLKTVYGHGEGIFLESDMVPEEAKESYKKVAKALNPIWKRFDDITTKQLIPSLKESGLGLVLDAKWSSKQWHNQLPAMEKPMPMLELGLLVGVSDGKGFEKAMTDYRKTINELYEAFRESAPNKENIPEFKIPAPEIEKGKNGNLIFYPLPDEFGLNKQFQPVAGVGKRISVIALSKAHADRLMASTPLKIKGSPLARKTDLIGASVLDWPAFVDAIAPWVEFGVMAVTIVPADDKDGPKKVKEKVAEIMKQAKVGFEVLKCFKGATSATFLEDGKLVTHTELIVKDLDKAPAKE